MAIIIYFIDIHFLSFYIRVEQEKFNSFMLYAAIKFQEL